MPRFNQFILTLWAGSLWTVCGLVVPGLFWLFPHDHKLAGNIAAQFFYAETFLGLLLGAIYLAVGRRHLDCVNVIAAAFAIAMPLLFFVALRPMMVSAREVGDTARFGQLHGVSSLLFVIACVAVGVLIWRAGMTGVNRRAE